MAATDETRWNDRYRDLVAGDITPRPMLPSVFEPHLDEFPTNGSAIEIACGIGQASGWLAARGVATTGYDISSVAIDQASRNAAAWDLSDRCDFVITDFDSGLPAGPLVDVVLCHKFRDRALYRPMVERLKPDGVLAIAVLSEVGDSPGDFRAPAGELLSAFASLTALDHGEANGVAWFLGRQPR